MPCGRYIVRVGALAVALGVGMAIGVAAHLAAADADGSTASNSATDSGDPSYYLSTTVGNVGSGAPSYSYLIDSIYPTRSQLASYVVNPGTLESGQVLASTDTFVVTVTDGHGGSTSTTISVPIRP